MRPRRVRFPADSTASEAEQVPDSEITVWVNVARAAVTAFQKAYPTSR